MSSFKIEKKNLKNIENSSNTLFNIIKSVLVAYTFTAITFIIYGILLTYTEMTEKNIQIVVIVTTIISVIIAGFITARGASSRGLFLGMLSGALYSIITLMVNFCIAPTITFTSKSILILILSIFGGGIGGIIGINTKK